MQCLSSCFRDYTDIKALNERFSVHFIVLTAAEGKLSYLYQIFEIVVSIVTLSTSILQIYYRCELCILRVCTIAIRSFRKVATSFQI